MTHSQFSFLVLLLAVVAFICGTALIGMANMDQTSQGWGLVGGMLWLISIPMGIAGFVLCVLSAFHRHRDQTCSS